MRTLVHGRVPEPEASRGRIILNVFVAFISLMLTIITVFMLVGFLSYHNMERFKVSTTLTFETHPSSTTFVSVWVGLSVNFTLISIFVVQHTFMAQDAFTNYIKQKGLHVLQRCIYIIFTCLTLQLLMTYWCPITCCTLWKLDTQESSLWWWFFSLIHLLAWTTVYGGCLIMDLGELLGIKQVYYNIYRGLNPIFYKSNELCGLYKHMRHPGYLSFAILLWCHPLMSLDRILLAVLWMAYMIWGFDVEHCDYLYCKHQLNMKIDKLN